MNRRHDTLLIGEAELRSGRRSRRPGPVGTAAIAAAVLVLVGLGFAVMAPLLAGSSQAEVLPATSTSPGVPLGTKASPGTTKPSASPTASLLYSLPPAAPARQTTHPAAAKPAQLEEQAIRLINQARSRAGCGHVKTDGHLRKAARAHSDDMARHGFVDHTGSDHRSYPQRAHKAGYRRPAGEAIGAGYPTAERAVNAWLTDHQQRGVLLNCAAKAVGVGVATARDGTVYWTADFGS